MNSLLPTSPTRIVARFKEALLAKDFPGVLGAIEAAGKKASQAHKTLPAKWKSEADAGLREIEEANRKAQNKSLMMDAKAMHAAVLQVIHQLSVSFSHKVAETAPQATWVAKNEEHYWDPEWIADGEEVARAYGHLTENPLSPLKRVAFQIQSEFNKLWQGAVHEFTPGEINRTLYALTPKELHHEADEVAHAFFSAVVNGDMVQSFRDLYAGVKKLSQSAGTSSAPKGMSPEDAAWELSRQAEKAHDSWTKDFAQSIATQLMRKRTLSPKQLEVLKKQLHKYQISAPGITQ